MPRHPLTVGVLLAQEFDEEGNVIAENMLVTDGARLGFLGIQYSQIRGPTHNVVVGELTI